MENHAKWITSPKDFGAAVYTCRKTASLKKEVGKATLYASAIGIYVPFINGKRVGKNVLAPGFTSYGKRVQYQTYDITDMLCRENVIEIGVGQGWAVGYFGYSDSNHLYADKTSLIAYAEIIYKDGSREIIPTDESWEVYSSCVTFSEIYHGETVDKTAPAEYVGNAVFSDVKTKTVPQAGEFITEHERLSPVEIIKTPKGETVIDFGQNMTGYAEVKICGKRGSKIVIHHAEVLDSDGNFYTANYRRARNEITYILSGKQDVFKPSYSFQGFRYIRLTEFPEAEINPDNFRAVAVHSEIKRTGYFRCGNEKINQLYHNIIWGQKSNYLDIPTDCPQRDERLGWTGDAQVFCRTAAINFDVEKFFEKWLGDVALDQEENGAVRGVIPVLPNTRISAAWGDIACIAPWELYLAYGNKESLKAHFPMMKKWVDYIRSAGPEEFLWLGGMHYGDWLAMDAGEDSFVGATSNDLIATAFFAHSTDILIKAGEIIGEDMSGYKKLYENIISSFQSYFMENGMPKSGLPYTEVLINGKTEPVDTVRHGMTQTALVLILKFNLCKENERPTLAKRLSEMIRQNGNRMTTGFVGTPYILHALSENGYQELAYELLFQEKNPSWLYSVVNGATTVWEHWNGIKEDGSFWNSEMNSFNHYAYGSVFDWIFGVVSGIKPLEENPGYKEITLAPTPDKRLGFAESAIDSRNGKITSLWYYKGDRVYYEFDIPEGVTAHLTLLSGYTEILTSGKYHFSE